MNADLVYVVLSFVQQGAVILALVGIGNAGFAAARYFNRRSNA